VLRKAGGSSNIRKILPLWGGPHGRSPWAVPRIAAALVGHLGGTAGGVRPTTQAISMKRTNAVAATLCALVLAAAALYSQAQTGAAHVVVDVSLGALTCAAVTAAILGRGWIAVALLVLVMGYWYDLRGQRYPAALQIPLKTVGQRALALSSLFSVLLTIGFW